MGGGSYCGCPKGRSSHPLKSAKGGAAAFSDTVQNPHFSRKRRARNGAPISSSSYLDLSENRLVHFVDDRSALISFSKTDASVAPMCLDWMRPSRSIRKAMGRPRTPP